MKISRKDLNSLYNNITTIINSKDDKYNYGLIHALIRNKHKIKNFIEEMADQQKEFAERSNSLFLEYANKDDEGKPIEINSGEKPEFDIKRKELEKIITDYFKEEIEFDHYKILNKYVPDENEKVMGSVAEVCYYFSEEE